MEALFGVSTGALVIGFLAALSAADRERASKLITLDDGSEERTAPQSMLLSRAADASPDPGFGFSSDWEDWISGVLETRSTFPMLVLCRSKHPGQHWMTALEVVTDAALRCQMIRGADNRAPRRSQRPAVPSERNRSRHLRPVFESTWNRSAVASIVHPRSRTQSTIRRRPSGVSGAFGCWLLACDTSPPC